MIMKQNKNIILLFKKYILLLIMVIKYLNIFYNYCEKSTIRAPATI